MSAEILQKLRSYQKNIDLDKVQRALDVCGDDPSPSELLDVVIPLNPDQDTILSVLLHKAYISDGVLSSKELRKQFGQGVYSILSGVKKLEILNYSERDESTQLEILRKMFLAMVKDLRVVFVSLSCRLYMMQNLEKLFIDEEQKTSFSKETLDLYVPVAARLGIYRMKVRLEDLAFKYSNPEEYDEISLQLNKLRKSCDISIAYIKKQLDRFLKSRGFDADISGRIKSVYSIYNKLKRKGLTSVDDLFDIFAIRIILPVKTNEDGEYMVDHLYGVLGLVHSEWKPVSRRFKDYLAVPKTNGYRSLHTVVLGIAPKDRDQPVEIQIRDAEMHKEAEYGVASHWLYSDSNLRSQNIQSQSEWIRGLGRLRSDFDIDREGIKEAAVDVFKDRIFVLTPRGDVKDLPRGAVPLDFAYSVHTDIGNKCVMAKVNGNIVPLDYELKNGDVVEAVTRNDSTPKLQWLSLVKTSFARNKIKSWFGSLNRENNIREGRRLLNNQLARIGKSPLDQNYSIFKEYLGEKLTLSQRESLVSEVGKGAKLASDVIRKIFPYKDTVIDKIVDNKHERKHDTLKDKILIGGESGLPIKIASCCKPTKGTSILGYITRGNRVTIHSSNCPLLEHLETERIVFADWKEKTRLKGPRFLVGIKVSAVGRVGLMRDVTSIISNFGVSIKDVAVIEQKSGISEEHYLIELNELDQFDRLIDKIENIKGVLKVVRDEKFKSEILK
ncbi:RelA/SpoT family protein [Candidatus Peregrinibacteria bacterium]|nr:RelA/SpoT family protein [Candidatus Peregrinibacteria bacterium]